MIRSMRAYHPHRATIESSVDELCIASETDPEFVTARQRLGELISTSESDPGSFVWVGLVEPSRAEMNIVARAFDLETLQVEDALNPRQRAKVDIEPNGKAFVLIKNLHFDPDTKNVETGQIAIFIGPDYAITVRHGDLVDLTQIRSRIEATPEVRNHGPYAVLHAVLDLSVDDYVGVIEQVSEHVSECETDVFNADPSRGLTERIYNLKRENIEVRRAVSPLVPAAQTFEQETAEEIPESLRPFFRDVGEHILRVSDAADQNDNLLMTMLMASTALQDLQQNRDMRKISAWVAIAAVPTMVAGIYGMNFEFMPELQWQYSYPVILGGLVITCALLYRAFKKSGWL